jgi:hypothetical protein
VPIDSHVPDFSGYSSVTPPQALTQRNGSTNPCANRHKQHTIGLLPFPFVELGHGGGVHIVVHHAGDPERRREPLGQWHVEPPVQHDTAARFAFPKIHYSGKADPGYLERSESLTQLSGCIQDEMTGFNRAGAAARGPDCLPHNLAILLDQASE